MAITKNRRVRIEEVGGYQGLQGRVVSVSAEKRLARVKVENSGGYVVATLWFHLRDLVELGEGES